MFIKFGGVCHRSRESPRASGFGVCCFALPGMALLLTVLPSAKPELKALVDQKDTEKLSAMFEKAWDREQQLLSL